jgi:hypothetical protein
MPTLHEILRQGAVERRSLGRTLISRPALVLFPGQTAAHGCCVRDVTNHGAGIYLTGLKVLPLDFDLSFDNFHTIRRCRLIWRDGDFVGVAMTS